MLLLESSLKNTHLQIRIPDLLEFCCFWLFLDTSFSIGSYDFFTSVQVFLLTVPFSLVFILLLLLLRFVFQKLFGTFYPKDCQKFLAFNQFYLFFVCGFIIESLALVGA